jgi:hypothetical protein
VLADPRAVPNPCLSAGVNTAAAPGAPGASLANALTGAAPDTTTTNAPTAATPRREPFISSMLGPPTQPGMTPATGSMAGMDGRAYLEKLIADRLGAGKGQPAAGREMSFNLWEVRGIAIGLVAAGALSQAEADRILTDLEATLIDSGWLRVVRHQVSMGPQGQAPVIAKRVGTARPEWRRAIEDPPTPELRDVVSLAGRTLTMGDQTATLLCLEVWTTMLTLRLAHRVDDPAGWARRRHGGDIRWRGWDDVGTQYRGGPGGGHGGHGWMIESCGFQPGPPEQATLITLQVEYPGGQATVPIPLST